MTHCDEIRVIFFHSSGPFTKKALTTVSALNILVVEKNRIEPFIRLVASFVSAYIHKGARKGQALSVTAIKFLYNIIFHMLRYMRVNA